jgi:glycosyltransferase involved in cell wall biosynthesis
VTRVAPKLSIIVVAWNVAPYIRQAIESCFQMSASETEILIIENASTDDTAAIARETIAGRGNARLVTNSTNTGLGPARNQGIALARGDYIAFLDGDDWFEEGGLADILARTIAADSDITVFDHKRCFIDGRISRGRDRRMLRRKAKDAFSARRNAVDLYQSAWNKLYRRSYLLAGGFQFHNSYYEDIDWTYATVLSAPKVITVPVTGVIYRKRPGSIIASVSPRHLEVMDRLRCVAEFVSAKPELGEKRWRQFMAKRLTNQVRSMLTMNDRLTWWQRVKLAHRARQVLRIVDPGYQYKAGDLPGKLMYFLLRNGIAPLAVALAHFR